MGRSGNFWHYKSDANGRLLSFKNIGTHGVAIEFKYEGDSRKAVAARLALPQNNWHYRSTPTFAGSSSDSECGQPSLRNGDLPFAGKPFRTGYGQLQKVSHPTGRNFALRTASSIGDGDNIDDLNAMLLQSYVDLQLFMDDMYSQLVRTPEEKQRCIDYCNDITDLAFISCGAFAVVGLLGGLPGASIGIALAFGCGIYFYDKRADCRAKCNG